jgi:hypothetical protein
MGPMGSGFPQLGLPRRFAMNDYASLVEMKIRSQMLDSASRSWDSLYGIRKINGSDTSGAPRDWQTPDSTGALPVSQLSVPVPKKKRMTFNHFLSSTYSECVSHSTEIGRL